MKINVSDMRAHHYVSQKIGLYLPAYSEIVYLGAGKAVSTLQPATLNMPSPGHTE
jgi:hypothetical protein